MKKLPRIIIFIFTTLLVISILNFIYFFADKLTDFSFANVVLEFYILFIAYLFFVLMLFDKIRKKRSLSSFQQSAYAWRSARQES